MRNIAIFCHDSGLSGANKSLIDWLMLLDKEKYHIILVIPKHNKLFEEQCKKIGIPFIIGYYSVTWRHLNRLPVKEKIKNLVKQVYNFTINPISLHRIRKRLEKEHIDLIHTNSFAITLGVKTAIKMKKPHIWHIREFMEEDHQIQHYSLKKVKKYCDYSSAIFISDVIAKKFEQYFKQHSTYILYNRINYDATYNKSRELFDKEICKITIIGTISENKGQEQAIKAVEQVHEKGYQVQLYICGTGFKEQELRKYVNKKQIDYIYFKGQVQNVNEIRKEMDIALMCSANEALGRVTIEAMYYQNLVIGANAGCTPYIIRNNENGYLYEWKNIEQLAKTIEYAIQHKEECRSMIKRANEEAIERFSKENYLDNIYQIYEETIKNGEKYV